jgi:hypothetical protein
VEYRVDNTTVLIASRRQSPFRPIAFPKAFARFDPKRLK